MLDAGWLQNLITYQVTLEAPAGNRQGIGRAIIDGALVIYDLDAPPAWLAPVLSARDEDGNVPAQHCTAPAL